MDECYGRQDSRDDYVAGVTRLVGLSALTMPVLTTGLKTWCFPVPNAEIAWSQRALAPSSYEFAGTENSSSLVVTFWLLTVPSALRLCIVSQSAFYSQKLFYTFLKDFSTL